MKKLIVLATLMLSSAANAIDVPAESEVKKELALASCPEGY